MSFFFLVISQLQSSTLLLLSPLLIKHFYGLVRPDVTTLSLAWAEWKPCGLIYCRRHLGEKSPRESLENWHKEKWGGVGGSWIRGGASYKMKNNDSGQEESLRGWRHFWNTGHLRLCLVCRDVKKGGGGGGGGYEKRKADAVKEAGKKTHDDKPQHHKCRKYCNKFTISLQSYARKLWKEKCCRRMKQQNSCDKTRF